MFTKLVKDRFVEELQFRCDATKEAVKTSLFNMVEEVIVDNTHVENMELLMRRALQALTQSDRFIKT